MAVALLLGGRNRDRTQHFRAVRSSLQRRLPSNEICEFGCYRAAAKRHSFQWKLGISVRCSAPIAPHRCQARSYELREGRFSAEFSVEEHDASGVPPASFGVVGSQGPPFSVTQLTSYFNPSPTAGPRTRGSVRRASGFVQILVPYRQVRRRRAAAWTQVLPAGALAIGGFVRSRWRGGRGAAMGFACAIRDLFVAGLGWADW